MDAGLLLGRVAGDTSRIAIVKVVISCRLICYRVVADPANAISGSGEVLKITVGMTHRRFELRFELWRQLVIIVDGCWRPLAAGNIRCGVGRQIFAVDGYVPPAILQQSALRRDRPRPRRERHSGDENFAVPVP